MSFIKHTNQSIKSENDKSVELPNEFTCKFDIGKTDHNYAKIKDESIDTSELEENNRQQADEKIFSTAAANAAIMKIKSELKFLCSLQVHQSNESFDSTNLEPSFELPIEDTLFLEGLLNNSHINSKSTDTNWLDDFPIDSIDQLLTSDPIMTFKEIEDTQMEQNDDYHYQNVAMTTDISSTTTQDDTTRSSADSVSDDNERDDINRRGLKKSGGPLRKLARFGNKQVIKYSDEYHDRRIKNNEAVKKSRMKAKEKHKETETKMSKLAGENRALSDRVDLLMKELQVLKSLYRELNQDFPASAVKALERVNVH